MNSFLAKGVQKWRTTVRLFRTQGFIGWLSEFLLFVTKPLRLLIEKVVWVIRTRSSKEALIEVEVHNNRMFLNVRDHGIARELALYRTHEPLSTQFLTSIVKKGSTIVDIGGNVGYFALLEAGLVGADGVIYALEPIPDNVKLLRKNVEVNAIKNVRVYETAIGDYTGKAKINLSEKSNWHTMFKTEWSNNLQIEVDIITLDDFIKKESIRSVDMVRMDIEGYETLAVNGMLTTLKSFKPIVFVELHPHITGGDAVVRFLGQFSDLGYTVKGLIDRSRDFPWRWRLLSVEQPAFDELINDSRIIREQKAISVFLG